MFLRHRTADHRWSMPRLDAGRWRTGPGTRPVRIPDLVGCPRLDRTRPMGADGEGGPEARINGRGPPPAACRLLLTGDGCMIGFDARWLSEPAASLVVPSWAKR